MKLKVKQIDNILQTLNESIVSEIGCIGNNNGLDDARRKRILCILKENILNEGIVSDDVLKCTEEVFDKFLEQYEKQQDRKNGCEITVNGVLGQKNIPVSFYGENTDVIGKINEPQGASVFRYGGKIVIVSVNFTLFRGNFKNKQYINQVKYTLLHELDHIYKQIMSGYRFHNSEIAAIAQTNLYSKNDAERMLACTLYASNEAEQDAMCAELYKECIDSGALKMRGNKEGKPAAYIWLEQLYMAHDYLISHKSDPSLKKALEQYENILPSDVQGEWENETLAKERMKKPFDKETWSFKKFRQRCEVGIKRFEARIAQTLKKAQTEMIGESYAMNIQWYKYLL